MFISPARNITSNNINNIISSEILFPQSIPNLGLWLSAQYSKVIKTSGLISEIKDLSKNNRNATQSDNSKKPLYNTTGMNGKPSFDSNISITSSMNIDLSFLGNSEFTIFALEKRMSGKNNNYFIGTQQEVINDGLHAGYASDTNARVDQYGNAINFDVLAFDVPIKRFWTIKLDSIGHSVYINNVLQASNANTTKLVSGNNGKIFQGFHPDATQYEGKISEVIIYNRALLTHEINNIYNFIKKSYNL